MAIGAKMGHQAKLSINAINTPFVSETLGKTNTHMARVGIRGTRSHDVDDVAMGPSGVAGTIRLEPTLIELHAIVNHVLGGDGVVAEAATAVDIIIDRVTNVYTYAGCKVSRLRIAGSQGGIITADLDIVGTTESDAGSVAEPASAGPCIFNRCTLTLVSAARPVEEFELIIDNAIEPKFYNSLTATDLMERDRVVTLRTRHPYNTTADSGLYDQALAGATGTLVINDGSSAGTFTFGKLQVPAESASVDGKGEIFLELNMTARKDGATREIAYA